MDFNPDWSAITSNLVHLGIAYLLAIPIAWNREKYSRSAGLRTFPMVAMSTCGYMLIGMQVLDTTDAEARVMYGIITGMGFIGGGAILKEGANVTGTATAASMWNTGAIGVSVAFNRYEIAIVLSLINFLILQFASPIKRRVRGQ